MLIRHLWQLKTVVFLHCCLIHTVLLAPFASAGEKKFYFIGQKTIYRNGRFINNVFIPADAPVPAETVVSSDDKKPVRAGKSLNDDEVSVATPVRCYKTFDGVSYSRGGVSFSQDLWPIL